MLHVDHLLFFLISHSGFLKRSLLDSFLFYHLFPPVDGVLSVPSMLLFLPALSFALIFTALTLAR